MYVKGFFDENEFAIRRENVFFATTRREKVEKIKSLNLDVFVDDLEEVFAEEDFPDIKKILFSSASKNEHHDVTCNCWTNIENSIIGEITNKEIKYIADSIIKFLSKKMKF